MVAVVGDRPVTPRWNLCRCLRRVVIGVRQASFGAGDGVKCGDEKPFRAADFSPARNAVPYGAGDESMEAAAGV